MTTNPSSSRTGILTLPVEIRLEIYKECLTPACAVCTSWSHPENHEHFCSGSNFSTSVLLLCKQINAEAKTVFYGANPFACALDTEDLRQNHNGVQSDRGRRMQMLRVVRKATVHIEMAGECIWAWKFPGFSPSHRAAIEYIHDGLLELCRDFENAPELDEVRISFGDNIYLQSWFPEGADDAGEESSIDRMGVENFDGAGYRYILEGLGGLRQNITIVRGMVEVRNKSDSLFDERIKKLETTFKNALAVVSTRSTQATQATQAVST